MPSKRNPYRTSRLLAALALAALAALPALADTRIERELALAPGGKLILDTDVGSVSVVGSSRSGARVVVTSTRDDVEQDFTFNFQERPGEVEITARKKGANKGIWSWFSWGDRGSLKWEIEVPHATALHVDTAGGAIRVEATEGDARLDTSGGAISVTGVQGHVLADTSGGSIQIEQVDGNVNADTSGGSIRVAGVRGDVRADTSGGSIEVRDVTGDVTADTSGGSIRIAEAAGRVSADTSGGSITVGFAPGNDRGGTISTSGGGIQVTLDPGVGLEIDAAASGGTVNSNLPVAVAGTASKNELRGTLGGGGERLKLRASGGGIRIEPL